MNQTILLCDSTPEGIFTGIYEAYERKCNPEYTHIQLGEAYEYQLFSEYIPVKTSTQKAEKVERTIRKKCSELTTQHIWYTLYSYEMDRGDAIYHTLVRGLSGAFQGELVDYLQDPYISRVSKLQLNVWHEAHHFMGFVRFRELKSGILYSEIAPRNHVLPLLGEHFTDRFPKERFIIKDKVRFCYLLHDAGKNYFLYQGNRDEEKMLEDTDSIEEMQIQNLFKTFCGSIAIKARENKSLQQQMLPLRFQRDMIEFQ